MIWPLGPIATVLAALVVAVAIWRKPDIRIPAIVLANYFVTAYARPLGLVAYGLADMTAVLMLCMIGSRRAITIATLFIPMMIAYVSETNAMVEAHTRQVIVEALALAQIVVLGVPNGWILAGLDRMALWRGALYRVTMARSHSVYRARRNDRGGAVGGPEKNSQPCHQEEAKRQ